MLPRRWIGWSVFALVVSLGLPMGAAAGELNVYYGMSRDLFDPTIKAFSDANPDIKVNSYRAPTEELMATIELELRAGKPRADVIVSVSSQLMGLQKLYKALDAFSPKDLGAVMKEMRDPENLMIPVGLNLYTIQYNTKRIPAADVPKGLLDVLNAKWNNQVVIADPKSSASVHTLFWFVTKYMVDTKGEPPYGWKYFQELRKINPRYVASHGTIRSLVQTGERPIGFQMLNDAMKSVTAGEPAAFILPQEGAPAEVTSISIVKGARNPKEARAFVDFLISPKGQELMHKSAGFVPIRTDAPFKLPDGRGLGELKLVPVDAAYVTPEKRQEHMQRFHEIMR